MSENSNVQAAAPPAAPAAEPPKTVGQKIVRLATIVVGVSAIFGGGMHIYHAFVPSLPTCGSDKTEATIRDIFKQKNVELTSLADMKTLTDTSEEKTCQASFATPSEQGTITYRISWQDKSAQVLITAVDTHPR